MTDWQAQAALLRNSPPKHLLFLCVANSARSQLAEGIAKSLAPQSIRISSAGSRPTQIRPEVLTVLQEIGIDGSRQQSKGLADVDGASVDAVITLCADEVCPVFPHPVRKLHWALPDPAARGGTEAERLQAFRDVRDELLHRLQRIF
jgi:arsenate reductase